MRRFTCDSSGTIREAADGQFCLYADVQELQGELEALATIIKGIDTTHRASKLLLNLIVVKLEELAECEK